MAGRSSRKSAKKSAPQMKLIDTTPEPGEGKVSKAKQIRDFWERNQGMKPKDIVEALGKLGVETTPQVVSTTISNAKKKAGTVMAGTASHGRAANGKAGRKAAGPDGGGIVDNGFTQAVEFIKAVGGFAQAKRMIEQLEELSRFAR